MYDSVCSSFSCCFINFWDNTFLFKSSWTTNAKCLALYSEDNLYYEAAILSVDEGARTAYVRFDYYENEEEVNLDELLPVECKLDLLPANDDVYSEQSYKIQDEKCSEENLDKENVCNVSILNNVLRITTSSCLHDM